jgi:hypothetical protein
VVGDEWHCGRCGLQWDINDGDPPECLGLQLKPNAVMTPTHPRYFKGEADPPDDPLAEARAILASDSKVR